MTEDDEIKRIKEEAEFSNDPKLIMKSIDALEPYGKKVIKDIMDIIEFSPHGGARRHGLAVIERIKKYSLK